MVYGLAKDDLDRFVQTLPSLNRQIRYFKLNVKNLFKSNDPEKIDKAFRFRYYVSTYVLIF